MDILRCLVRIQQMAGGGEQIQNSQSINILRQLKCHLSICRIGENVDFRLDKWLERRYYFNGSQSSIGNNSRVEVEIDMGGVGNLIAHIQAGSKFDGKLDEPVAV